ncbi:MAG: hypothetical protein J6S84_02015 [Bacteroidales bacterium]|nr:hypothetical protein [Bacteroidales bacterium]
MKKVANDLGGLPPHKIGVFVVPPLFVLAPTPPNLTTLKCLMTLRLGGKESSSIVGDIVEAQNFAPLQ